MPRVINFALGIFIMNKLFLLFLLTSLILSCEKEVIQVADSSSPREGDIRNIGVKNMVLNDQHVVVASSSALQFFQVFDRTTENGEILEFTPLQKSFPNILEDQYGNIYNVFGIAEDGPDKGRSLKTLHAGVGFWFAWSSTFPKIVLADEEGTGSRVESSNPEWLVSQDYVFRGAASDGIPAINDPVFKSYTNKQILTSGLLRDDDELIIVKIGETTKIYPIKILNYHEIVNDVIDGKVFSVCYAPFTNTSSVWSRTFGTAVLEFGVSGLVYNNNILLFDRSTKSFWNQLLEISVNGAFQSTKPNRVRYFRSKWSTWKETSNTHLVLKGIDELEFDYDADPLGDYSLNHAYLPFEISSYDSRLKIKSTVLGVVIDGEAFAFRYEDF
jgi:hypothetical protein